MKISLSKVMEIKFGLDDILTISLPAKISYRFAKLFQKINSEVEALEKTRRILVNKYAKKDKDGQLIVKKDKEGNPTNEYDFIDSKMKKFVTEYSELVKENIEVDFVLVKLKELGNAKLKPMTLVWLEKFIKE